MHVRLIEINFQGLKHLAPTSTKSSGFTIAYKFIRGTESDNKDPSIIPATGQLWSVAI